MLARFDALVLDIVAKFVKMDGETEESISWKNKPRQRIK